MAAHARPRRTVRPRTTRPDHTAHRSPNLLAHAPPPSAPGDQIVSDITYIPTREGWLYLAVVLDLFSRAVLGWRLSGSLHTVAMRRALDSGLIGTGAIFYSDRGCQYTAAPARGLLAREGLIQSMSTAAGCYDKAYAESAFASLKSELPNDGQPFNSKAAAATAVFDCLEAFDNRRRLHSALGYQSQKTFLAQCFKSPKNAKPTTSTCAQLPHSFGVKIRGSCLRPARWCTGNFEVKKDSRHPANSPDCRAVDLTFVFPCLNEEKSLGECITKVRQSLEKAEGLRYEIVVADNGSTDRSREIATSLGARVVPVPKRGYGAALSGGIEAAAGRYVMFADADNTYLYEHALPLYEATEKADADMGIASRIKGDIKPGAMPTLHRYLGTPVLTSLINLFFQGRLSDCNSGFRCLKKTSFQSWDVRSSGMEFASELLIKALKHQAKCVEIPSGLNPNPPDRVPHLRTWRDGMRHLLFIFSERPQVFEWLGLLAVVAATLLQVLAVMTGPVNVAGLNIFDLHSQALLLLAGLMGTQFYMYACMCYLRSSDRPSGITRWLITMDEGTLFFLLTGVLAAILGVVLSVFVIWAGSSFAGLNLTHTLVAVVHFLSVPLLMSLGLLGLHTLKRYER